MDYRGMCKMGTNYLEIIIKKLETLVQKDDTVLAKKRQGVYLQLACYIYLYSYLNYNYNYSSASKSIIILAAFIVPEYNLKSKEEHQ